MRDKNKRYEYFIYKIYNPDCDYIYVGSTRDMTTRKSTHKSACNNVNNKQYNCKVYKTIRANGGWDEWFMVVVEVMPDVTKLQAEMQEDVYRIELNATLNSRIATRGDITLQEYKKQYKIDNKETIQQYYNNNKQQILEQKKQYYIDNKEKITQKHNCDCGGKYSHQKKGRHMKTQKHKQYISTLNNL